MAPDKFAATWVSHSSICDFQHCPRAYYLKNIYKDPKTNRKLQIISPPLALGQVVHTVLESLSKLPADKRFQNGFLFQGKKVVFLMKKLSITTKNGEKRCSEG